MPATNATMNVAVFRAKGSVPVEVVPLPTLQPDEVLVEIAYCGICGTDLHAIVEASGLNGWGTPGWVGGHEWSGHVNAVGADVSAWKVGDRVVGSSSDCGACPNCRAGRPSLCRERGKANRDGPGAFAQFIRKGESRLEAVPDGLDLRAAALAEPLAVALHAVTRSMATPGSRVLVTGAGPIGALTVVALHSRGLNKVTVSEPNPIRRALVQGLGADVLTPDELTAGSADGTRHDFDAIIETSGHPAAASSAIDYLGLGGVLVLVGVVARPTNVNLLQILQNELVITGSALYDSDGIRDAVALLASGTVPVNVLIEPSEITLSEVGDTCMRLAEGQIAGKVLVVPNRSMED
ncbi:MAG TPA: alcohol dehydrogenase catalytic domain-containing protein [Acidimicrobiales bacterium]|nr:alcohol dehydrogenase catalytic domain-containing protein [Acidimicrobiales bacterium]